MIPRWAAWAVVYMLIALIAIAVVPRAYPVLINLLPIAGEDP